MPTNLVKEIKFVAFKNYGIGIEDVAALTIYQRNRKRGETITDANLCYNRRIKLKQRNWKFDNLINRQYQNISIIE